MVFSRLFPLSHTNPTNSTCPAQQQPTAGHWVWRLAGRAAPVDRQPAAERPHQLRQLQDVRAAGRRRRRPEADLWHRSGPIRLAYWARAGWMAGADQAVAQPHTGRGLGPGRQARRRVPAQPTAVGGPSSRAGTCTLRAPPRRTICIRQLTDAGASFGSRPRPGRAPSGAWNACSSRCSAGQPTWTTSASPACGPRSTTTTTMCNRIQTEALLHL